jgi:polyisoprenoid-binding protein YceI
MIQVYGHIDFSSLCADTQTYASSMVIQAGTFKLGPRDGTLSVRTARTGAAAKAGHDLLLHVTDWEATIEAAADPAQTSVGLVADATSLRVQEGTGGMQPLEEKDIASIHESIDADVLRKQDIAFRSTRVESADDGRMHVEGDLTLAGTSHPIGFDLVVSDDGRISGRAVVKQTDWDIKPYSILFGALKVADEVDVEIDAGPPPADAGQSR